MTSVSPHFFVVCRPSIPSCPPPPNLTSPPLPSTKQHLNGGRNSIWDFDNHLYANRWELLVQQRNSVDAVEIVSWNGTHHNTPSKLLLTRV